MFISLLVCSCEQIIEVRLQDDQPKVVIESSVTNGRGPFLVKLSKSQSYFNQTGFIGIEKALVQLDDSFTHESLTEKGSGFYSTKRIRGIPGHTYHLNVTNEGEKFSASVQLPPPVLIDTVYFKSALFSKDSLNIFVEFNDPEGVENYYRIKLYRNGQFAVNDYYIITDAFSDGQKLWAPFYYREFAPGDSVRVELLNLERNTWRYLKGLGETIEQGVNVQAPGNPPSNMEGGALGFFGAWGISTYKTTVPR